MSWKEIRKRAVCYGEKRAACRRVKLAAAILCASALSGILSGCGKDAPQEKIVITTLYTNDFKHFEQLVESTYGDIDLQCERISYTSEQLHRLEKGMGPDLVITPQPSDDIVRQYLLDISDTSASTAYDGTIMKTMKRDGKTYLIPLPGQYTGCIINETFFQEAGLPLPTSTQQLVESLALLKEQGTGIGEDGTNFAVFSDYNSDFGMFYVGCMVPDFLGTVDGVRWMRDFEDKKDTLSGTWERSFDLAEQMTSSGLLDLAALGRKRNLIRYYNRMGNGTLAAVYGNTSLFAQCVEENRIASEEGRSQKFSYRMLPLLSQEGNEPWLLFSPTAYMGINAFAGSEKQEACRRIIELLSSDLGQESMIADLKIGFSCLKGYPKDKELILPGLKTYIDTGYVYNVHFPDKVVEYMGINAKKVMEGKLTVEEALASVDRYYYEGSETVDYDLTVIGIAGKDMLQQNFNVRRREAEIGNFLADCVAEASGSPIAVVNSGGIRGSLYQGEIYGGDLEVVCPFDNLIVVLEMKGSTIWEMLENSLSACTKDYPGGRFLQVSGLRYTFDSGQLSGQRLKEVTLADGSPLRSEQTYQVAVNDYMAGKQGYAEENGDGFTMLNFYSDDIPKGKVTLIKETEITYRDALAGYFTKHQGSPVGTELEGRITDTAGTP